MINLDYSAYTHDGNLYGVRKTVWKRDSLSQDLIELGLYLMDLEEREDLEVVTFKAESYPPYTELTRIYVTLRKSHERELSRRFSFCNRRG